MSTIRTNTLLAADGSTTTEPSIPALDQRMAKAWVNFNGQNTLTVRSSYNVSSVTDIETGRYQVNYTVALADANYSACASKTAATTYTDSGVSVGGAATTKVQVDIVENNVYADSSSVSVIILGN